MAGVGEQGEGAGDQAGDQFDDEERRRQRERDRQPGAVPFTGMSGGAGECVSRAVTAVCAVCTVRVTDSHPTTLSDICTNAHILTSRARGLKDVSAGYGAP